MTDSLATDKVLFGTLTPQQLQWALSFPKGEPMEMLRAHIAELTRQLDTRLAPEPPAPATNSVSVGSKSAQPHEPSLRQTVIEQAATISRLEAIVIECAKQQPHEPAPSPEPAGWRYKTQHGWVITKTKVNGDCEPLYARTTELGCADAKFRAELEIMLYSGHEVLTALTPDERRRTSPENVGDVLNSMARATRAKVQATPQPETKPEKPRYPACAGCGMPGNRRCPECAAVACKDCICCEHDAGAATKP
jgi:hypothetical protein